MEHEFVVSLLRRRNSHTPTNTVLHIQLDPGIPLKPQIQLIPYPRTHHLSILCPRDASKKLIDIYNEKKKIQYSLPFPNPKCTNP